MSHRSAVRAVLIGCLVSTAAPAQDAGAHPDLAPKQALLQKALHKMAALPSCTFATRQQNSRLSAAANAARPGAAPVQVVAAGAAATVI